MGAAGARFGGPPPLVAGDIASDLSGMSKTSDQSLVIPAGSARPAAPPPAAAVPQPEPPKEIGGPKGKDPTRYGDWENKGRCIDF